MFIIMCVSVVVVKIKTKKPADTTTVRFNLANGVKP